MNFKLFSLCDSGVKIYLRADVKAKSGSAAVLDFPDSSDSIAEIPATFRAELTLNPSLTKRGTLSTFSFQEKGLGDEFPEAR
jgi:hypothetical protein